MRYALTDSGESSVQWGNTLNRLGLSEYLKARQTEPEANSFICSALSHRHLLVKAGNAADVTTLVCSWRNPEWWLYIRFSTSPTIIYKCYTYYGSGQVSQNIVCRLWQAPFAYCNKTTILSLKEISHHLLTPMSFQTCTILFLLRSRK